MITHPISETDSTYSHIRTHETISLSLSLSIYLCLFIYTINKRVCCDEMILEQNTKLSFLVSELQLLFSQTIKILYEFNATF